MNRKLHPTLAGLLLAFVFAFPYIGSAQTTVFSSDFSTSAGTTYATSNGPIGSNSTWSLLRSGSDFGGVINSGALTLTNDATGSYNIAGWALAYSNNTIASPYTPVLTSNPGQVTWTFNMRQSRSNPSGMASSYYANAFVLAGTSNTTATTGSGYAVTYGQSGSIDPIRIIRYTAGLRTSTNVLSTINATSDIGNQYLSVKVVYTPSTNKWELYARIDGTSAFQDPATGNLTLVGSGTSSPGTTSYPLIGGYWNAGIKTKQTSAFDNITVAVTTPAITSISPTSKVAGTGAFTLTVNGTNFTNGSTVRWNGSNRSTTFVNATQLTAAITATDVASPGSSSITVGTGNAVSNAETFTIDPPAIPSVSPSTTALTAFSTVTLTASAAQSFTVTGANLTADAIVSGPTYLEFSKTSATSGFADTQTLTRSGTTLSGQPVTVYARVKSSATAGIYTGNISIATTGGATKQIAVSATVFALEPTTSSSTLSFTNVTSISFTSGWTSGNGANRLVVIKASGAVDSAPVDGTTYTASSTFGQGSELGSGNFVVYNGPSNSVNISNLSPATTYYVAVYEYNGSAGSQNYRTTSPLIGMRLTQNAPVGLQISALNTASSITFDSSVEGVNNSVYNGGSITADPAQGELNSKAWAFTGFSDGNIAFGGESPEDSSYESGTSDGGEDEAGVYAFLVGPNNYALGVQPAAGEFSPGTITLKFQNQTSTAITSVSVGYKVYVYNDEAGSNSLNFSYSADNTTYSSVPGLNLTTTAAAEVTPGWRAYFKVYTIPVSIAANGYGYIRWSGAAVSGTAYDEIAIDDIVLVANPTTTFASLSGIAETFTVAGNTMLSGSTTVKGDIAFSNNSYLAIGANTLTLSGTVTNTSTGGLRGSTSSNLTVNGTVSPTLSFDQTTAGATNMLNNLTIATTNNNTVTAGNALGIAGTLTVNELQTFNLGTNALSGTLTTVANSGTISTQNTSSSPLPSGKTWSGTGIVKLNAASAQQTLVTGTYTNVTINTTGGAITNGTVTVNGTLYLPNANPSSTTGSLATGSNSLIMGPDAVNTGVGEVSGIVTRNSGIIANKTYTFGHPYTTIIFPQIGALPSSMSLKIEPGVAPPNKPNSVLRRYEFIQTGGSGTKAIITSHYLDSELNGNTESRLVDWVVPMANGATPIEQSRTNYSTTNNFVELANVNAGFFSSTFGTYQLTFADSQATTLVWNGSQDTSWTTAANWTPNGSPAFDTTVIIPNEATTPHDPTYNSGSEVASISIEAGGILNAPDASTFTVKGAWINNGTFNASTGTVVFDASPLNDVTIAGTTTFNSITVAANNTLRSLTNAYIRLNGTFTKVGNFATGGVHSTFEYSGTNQTVVTPNGAGLAYHNLVISGTGTVFPTSLTINGNLTLNQSVDFTGKTVVMGGSEEEGQTIGGLANPVFNNLTINNTAASVSLATNTTVSGTLTLTNGIFNIGNSNLTLGTNAVAGSFSSATMIEADANGVVRKPYTGTGTYTFPVGEGLDTKIYSPITVNIISGTFNNAYVSVNMRDAKHPNNNSTTNYLTHYWNVTQTGISNAVATITAAYTPEDIVGTESGIVAAQLNGTFNQVTNPWVKFNAFSGGTLTATNATLTAGQASVFTGINGSNLSAAITGEGAFCEGDVVTLSSDVSGGTTPYIYTWSGGLGSGTTATPPTTNPGTTAYTLTVTDANGIVSSDTANVVVSTPPVAGTLSDNQEICANTAPADITLTGYNGTIVRWERSTSTAFANPAFISSTSATLTGAQIGNLTTTRYIRAVVQNGSCPVVYSDPVEIKISSTTWNGTWSNGVPTATTAAIFNSDFTASGDMEACSVTVNTDAHVVIPSGFNMTVNGAVTVNGGTFTIQNNANLIQIRDVDNSGSISVIKDSAPIYRLDYTLWSSPVADETLEGFSPETLSNRFYHYNPLSDAYAAVPGNTTFAEGVSYLIRVANTHPAFVNQGIPGTPWRGTFEGVPNNGDVNVAVTPAGSGIKGFNAVGNPYPSAINIAAFFAENQNNLSATSPIYFWRKKNDSSTSSYASLTLAGYNANSGNSGGDSSNDVFNDPDNSDEWVINPGQGFIVKAITGTVSFNNEMRRAVNNGQFFRTAMDNPDKSRLWLNLTNNDGAFSQTTIAYTPVTTLGLDYGWDGLAITDGDIAVYSIAEDTKLGIQARPAFEISDVVPLEYKITTAGTYTIGLDHVDGVFTQGQEIFLRDNLLGQTHNLTESAYEFATEGGIITGRFDVIYGEALGTDIPAFDSKSVIVYKHDNAITINTGSIDMKSVSIYDTRGRLLYSADGINDSEKVINTLQSQEQMLIIEITTTDGTKVAKKIAY